MTDEQYRHAAREEFHEDGVIEIDPDAKVSRNDDDPEEGAYVQAWVWVDAEDADEYED